MPVGKHIIADLYGVSPELIAREETVVRLMEEVMEETGLHRVSSISKQFNPHGVTAIVLVSESHVAIHTWPEYELVNLDIFTCSNEEKTEKAFNAFLEKFKPKYYRHMVIDRGGFNE
ncbi:MAG: adenosylmethionine decarboxylase [Thermoplasmata archaeon]